MTEIWKKYTNNQTSAALLFKLRYSRDVWGEIKQKTKCWPALSFIKPYSWNCLSAFAGTQQFYSAFSKVKSFHSCCHSCADVKSFHCQPSPHSSRVLVKSKKGHDGILCDTAWSRFTSTLEKLRTIFIISNLRIIIFPYGPYSRSTTNIKERNMKSMQREGWIWKSNCWGYSICSFCEKKKEINYERVSIKLACNYFHCYPSLYSSK